MELFFFGGARQGLHGGRTTLNDGGHIVEVTSAHFLLVRHEGVTLVAGCELWLLHHVHVVLHAFAVGISMGELEGVEPVDVDACQGDELVFVAQRGQVFLERSDLFVVEFFFQLKEGEQL